jgi:ubiquinone/menaquinone biosynthesis C-methylase UbiE
MKDNTNRFTGKVAAYERYRQRYPTNEILTHLRSWCSLTPDWTIADVGAGTGMLTEVFLANGNQVIAIEPNAEMRTACEQLSSPLLKVVDATAESTGLPDNSVEMVAAGRAFHWFDTERALAEFRRILKPGGWVALVSAGRANVQTPQALAFEHLLTEHATDHAYARTTYRVHDRLDDLFGELHQERIHGELSLDWNAFQGMTQSLSVVPQETAPSYPTFQAELKKYFQTYAPENLLTMQTTCWVDAGRL